MVFVDVNSSLHSDVDFIEMVDKHHHTSISPLIELGIQPVSHFPLHYMHLVCLSAMRKLIDMWMPGKRTGVLSAGVATAMSIELDSFRPYMPSEFSQRPRSIFEFRHWKATELRQFLLYTGPVVLKNKLPHAMYQSFLYFSVAIRILLKGSNLASCDYANELLRLFVRDVACQYGKEALM